MVLTKSDSSASLVEPMKNRSAGEKVQAYQALIDCLNTTDIFPLEHILNNKFSALFKQQIQLNKMTYQLVPLHNHRRNQDKKQSKLLKTISYSSYAAQTPVSPSIFGVDY